MLKNCDIIWFIHDGQIKYITCLILFNASNQTFDTKFIKLCLTFKNWTLLFIFRLHVNAIPAIQRFMHPIKNCINWKFIYQFLLHIPWLHQVHSFNLHPTLKTMFRYVLKSKTSLSSTDKLTLYGLTTERKQHISIILLVRYLLCQIVWQVLL